MLAVNGLAAGTHCEFSPHRLLGTAGMREGEPYHYRGLSALKDFSRVDRGVPGDPVS